MPRARKFHPRRARGFSLVEVILALGIMSFALVTIFGLISVGLNDATNSTEKNRAVALLSGIAADLGNTPPTLAKSPLFQIAPVPFMQAGGVAVPNGAIAVGSDIVYYAGDDQQLTPAAVTAPPSGASKFRVTLRYTRVPGASMVSADTPAALASMEALVVISWPPNADPFGKTRPAPQGSVETYLALPVP